MSNEDKPMTSRRERRLAQASLDAAEGTRLTPAQAEAEARGRAEAEAAAARERAEAEAAAARERAAAQARADAEAAARERATARRAAQSAAEAAARAEAWPSSADRSGGESLRARRSHEADPGQPQAERSSQARARDRAAQRVRRELAEKEQAAQQSFPTRRSIRERETGKLPTVGTPLPATQPEPEGGQSLPAQALPVIPAPHGHASHSAGSAGRAPVPGVDPAPPTAMQGIVPQGLTVTPALGPETGSFRRLSHDQITAARELLKEQAKNQTAMLEAQRGGSGTDVDPAVLAEQVAMAERAAILNRRAQAKQRLAEESRRDAVAPPRKAPAPAATDNLAMVTPLEFVRLPGVPHPVMKPPSTTHVPVITGRTARQRPPQPVSAPMSSRRTEPPEGAPVSARSAHGLDPLNSAEAGAGRAERERLILLGVAAVGLLALIVAIIMIVLGSK
ncbi:hypothetical protein [Sinomonas sp. P10A9]|uniref:Uncharacterized protein n=1 Tax=Sinomonas puerhi TaxID=3238584 RepID=A0AB39L0C7_9MICC